MSMLRYKCCPGVGGVRLSEEADLDSGRINLQIVAGTSRWRLAGDWYRRMLGFHGHAAAVVELAVRQARISASPPQKVSIDGEVLAHTPFTLRLHPRAVNVVVPCANGLPQAQGTLPHLDD